MVGLQDCRKERSEVLIAFPFCNPAILQSCNFPTRFHSEIFMLAVSNLTKHYPTARGPLTVLADVSFSLAAGEAAAVMGPSGAGKSSLLYLLGALEPPSAGTITLGGVNPFTLGPRELAAFRNASIGFVFQDHCLLPQLSVLENVLVPTLVAPAANRDLERAR